MAKDIIDELLNSGSVPPEQLAEVLRRQHDVGTIGALSGSSRIGPIGGMVRNQALSQAAGIGDNRRDAEEKKAANTLEEWKARMQAQGKRDDLAARQEEGRLNRASREGIANSQIGSREKLASSLKKADENAAKMDEIGRQMEAALGIAEESVEKHGSDGGPVIGRTGIGLLTGAQDAFEGDMAGMSNAVRAQIRLYFKDTQQSNLELRAFEANIPKWQDLPDVRRKKLQNIRAIYAPESLRERAGANNGALGPARGELAAPDEQYSSDEDAFDAFTQ